MPESKQTRVDIIIHWLRNHSVFSFIIVGAMVVISLGALTDALSKILNFIGDSLQWHMPHNTESKQLLMIKRIKQVDRRPIWGMESFDEDEIVASINGSCSLTSKDPYEFQLITFWRLSNAYETNWHVGRRRVGGNYRIATLDGQSAIAGDWDFLVGGIEADKNFSGAIAVVVVALPNEYIKAHSSNWLDDENGWGFETLPFDERLATSPPATFETKPVRE